jgi:cytidyltransferase-like protein
MEKKTKGLVCYVGGTFDMIHRGHLDLLEWCRRLAGDDGVVYVALNSDDFVERFKGRAPITSFEDRKAILEALEGLVDTVIENIGGEDSKITIMQVKPDIIVVGSDWLKKDYCKQMSFTPDWLEENRIALAYIPRHLDISSTKIKLKCQS